MTIRRRFGSSIFSGYRENCRSLLARVGSDYEIFMAVPESVTLGLLLLGGLALLRRRRSDLNLLVRRGSKPAFGLV